VKKIYVFRHGETDWNREGRSMGWLDVPLNQNGIEQAKKLAESLKDAGLEIIYSSPLSRTLETAKIVAGAKNIEIIQNDALKERNNGILEGSIANIEFPDICKKIDNPDFAPPGGGESRSQLRARALNFIKDIIKTSDKNIIGISTHNGVALTILIEYIGRELPPMNMPNSSYYRLDWDGEKLQMNGMPDWLSARYA
jgi:broad specificity phosphatase PhoE